MCKIGIIAGKGLLPLQIAVTCLKQGKKPYVIVLGNEADLTLFNDFPKISINVGLVSNIISYLKKNEIEIIVFAGKVYRPNFSDLKVDFLGAVLVGKLLKQKFCGDDSLLKIVSKFFEDQGFKIISPKEILLNNECEGLIYQKVLTNYTPSITDKVDIELGVKVLEQLSIVDVGQSVIVKDGYVIGIEAAEGTDNLLSRCAILKQKQSGGVLVKLAKQGQSLKMDLPTIGPKTILNLVKYKYNGVAIQKNLVLVINSDIVIKLADKNKVFIIEV